MNSNSSTALRLSKLTIIKIRLLFIFLHIVSFFPRCEANFFTLPSGRQLPISAVHRHVPNIDAAHLPRFVFELSSTHISSHHASVPLPPLHSSVQLPPTKSTFYLNGVKQTSDQSPTYLLRSANLSSAFTFVLSSADVVSADTLHAVFGPSLNLHPVDPVNHPGIFLNSALHKNSAFTTITEAGNIEDRVAEAVHNTNARSSSSLSSLSRNIDRPCFRMYTFELAIAYDITFCALYGSNAKHTNKVLSALIYEVSQVFQKSVCVSLKYLSMDAHCDADDANKFSFAKQKNRCPTCDGSSLMLKLITRDWSLSVSKNSHRDAGIFFSGYSDGSDVAGATYRAQACNERLSFAWVEHDAMRIVFAHEVGHMLGAQHDNTGIMTPSVNLKDEIVISPNTKVVIRKFVQTDARAWCLRRNYLTYGALQRLYKWNLITPVLRENAAKPANVSDITFAQIREPRNDEKDRENDMIFLISERNPADGSVNLYYFVSFGISCNARGACGMPRAGNENSGNRFRLPFSFVPNSFAFSVAYGNLKNSTSRDIVIAHVRPHVNGKLRPFYRVGHGIAPDGTAPPLGRWQRERNVRFHYAENLQCAGIAQFKHAGKNYLLFAQIDDKNGRNVLQYSVGKDISPTGYARGGWTGLKDVTGWYGRHVTSISVAVTDVDENGIPDVVFYHVDNTPTFKIGYIRVGKDLDVVKGSWNITKGLTDFVRAAALTPFTVSRAGAMAVHLRRPLGGNLYPVVATVQRGVLYGSVWNLYFGASVLTPALMRSSKDRPALQDLSAGCNECYAFNNALQCKRDLSRCSSTIDRVKVRPDEAGLGKAQPSPIFEFELEEEEEHEDDDEFINDPTRPKEPNKDSIFCTGFHFMYTKRTGCDVVDRTTVFAKGLEQVFLKLLAEEGADVENDVRSTSLFETPAGTNGNSNPIVAQFELWDKRLTYRQAVERAIKRIRSRKGFSKLGNLRGPGIRRTVERRNGQIIVKFFFTNKHKLEIPG